MATYVLFSDYRQYNMYTLSVCVSGYNLQGLIHIVSLFRMLQPKLSRHFYAPRVLVTLSGSSTPQHESGVVCQANVLITAQSHTHTYRTTKDVKYTDTVLVKCKLLFSYCNFPGGINEVFFLCSGTLTNSPTASTHGYVCKFGICLMFDNTNIVVNHFLSILPKEIPIYPYQCVRHSRQQIQKARPQVSPR